jgi:hypothetical protein
MITASSLPARLGEANAMSTARKSLEQIRREGGGQRDRRRLDALSEADIERMAEDDATPEPSQDDLAHARVVRPYQTNSA